MASPNPTDDACRPALRLAGAAVLVASLVLALVNARAGEAPMRGALADYPMGRDGSGTAWQPDTATMAGLHAMGETWTSMVAADVALAATANDAPRGALSAYQTSMFMVHASRFIGAGDLLTVKAMGSLEPLEGPTGYPLLLQTGESADGRTPLVDRQHPHNLVMEASVTLSHALAADRALFAYVALAGEPALGPVAFMHRFASMDNVSAPLTHHWLDSTHLSYGVVTAGWAGANLKAEASAFNGREPDQHRYAIETGPLDSWALRLTLNPAPEWSAQVSHARLRGPERLEPGQNVVRDTASLTWHPAGDSGREAETVLAVGRNAPDGRRATTGVLIDQAYRPGGRLTFYGRLEYVEKDEILPEAGVTPVAEATVGIARTVGRYGHLDWIVGAQASLARVGSELEARYGGRHPLSGALYVRLRLGS
jgi:hypothetical protein